MNIEDVQQKLINYRNIMLFMLIFPWLLFFSPLLIPGIGMTRIVVYIWAFIFTANITSGIFMLFFWWDNIRPVGQNMDFLRKFDEETGNAVTFHSYSPFSGIISGMARTVVFSTHDPSLPQQFNIEFHEKTERNPG